MKIIGATITTGATIGVVLNVGGSMYMVTGRPWVMEAVAGVLGLYSHTLATRPTPEDDEVLGNDTLRISTAGGSDIVSGPYNAIEAIRGLLPASLKAA